MSGALWVALVASGAALVTAVATPLSTWLVARLQRQANETSRVYPDKLQAYLATALDTYRGRELVADCAEELARPGVNDAGAKALVDKLESDIYELNEDEPKRLAQLVIVAPDSVMEAREALVEAWNDATNQLFNGLDRTTPGFAQRARELTRAAEPKLLPAMRHLRTALRDDLSP